jgi:hydroxypyruvate isomerase
LKSPECFGLVVQIQDLILTRITDAMPRFSANLGFLFSERPEIERIEAAADAGFTAVELHWPYAIPAAGIRSALARTGLKMLGLNTPLGDEAAGDFGLGAIPGRQSEFEQAFDKALSYGAEIGATSIHCMSGVVPVDDMAAAEITFIENLRQAADKAAQASMTLLIEPINHRDKPGYFLHHVEQAASIIERIGRMNVKIMFDCYHVQIMQGDLIRRLKTYQAVIGHVQIAGVPSRAEPDEGELNYSGIFQVLDEMGYEGWVGAEYKPRGRTEDGLGWLSARSGAGSQANKATP